MMILARAAVIGAALCLTPSCSSDEGAQEILPRSISLSEDEIVLEVGQTHLLTAAITPSTVSDKTVKWSSSNTAKVTVDENGTVTAVSKGTAYVVAETCNAIKSSCLVKVTQTEPGSDPVPDPEPDPTPDPDPTPEPQPLSRKTRIPLWREREPLLQRLQRQNCFSCQNVLILLS